MTKREKEFEELVERLGLTAEQKLALWEFVERMYDEGWEDGVGQSMEHF